MSRICAILMINIIKAVSILILLLPHAAFSVEPTDFSINCRGTLDNPVAEELELGDFLFLIDRISNTSDQDATIVGTMKENSIFGPERIVLEQDLPSGIGIIVHDGGFGVPTDLTNVPTTDTIVVEFTTDKTGTTVIDRCVITLTVVLPEDLRKLVQVPVRFCAMEGSAASGGAAAGETVDGEYFIGLLQTVNDEIWTPQARIAFRSAFASDGIPVIADVDGDLFKTGMIASDNTNLAAFDCEKAWDERYPEQRGIPVVVIFAMDQYDGVSPMADRSLIFSGGQPPERGDALCGHPRNLLVSDVSHMYTVFGDGNILRTREVITLAHELGHNLLLGHGNGLDDNMDGLEPPSIGPRRYDGYCDPLRTAEDLDSPDEPCDEWGSLLDAISCTEVLRPLQVEQARAAAKLFPGAVFDAAEDPAGWLVAPSIPDLSPDISIHKVELAITPESATTAFSHTVLGPLAEEANNQYMVFADLDNDPASGCLPSAFGFPTELDGVELVATVTLTAGVAVPSVWKCQTGNLVHVDDPGIQAFAATQHIISENGSIIEGSSSVIKLLVPDDVRGPIDNELRLQAVARKVGIMAELDRLPADDAGGIVSLTPPTLPECSLSPSIAAPGESVTVEAHNLIAERTANVFIGDQLLAVGNVSAAGEFVKSVVIPASSRTGLRPVSVVLEDAAVSADCAVVVQGDRLTPATFAEIEPGPNGAGWNRDNVTLSLTAQPIPGGAPIAAITHSESGAQTDGPTTVTGDEAFVVIVENGVTTVEYFSVDDEGIKETTQRVTVKLDKTDPVITGSRSAEPNSLDWHNSDVTVLFECTDQVSGVLFCSPQITLSNEGAAQSVVGDASDLAGNISSVMISGINIDKTPPNLNMTPDSGRYVTRELKVAWNTSDQLSGIDYVSFTVNQTEVTSTPSGEWILPPGTYSVEAEAADQAGNISTEVRDFTIVLPVAIDIKPGSDPNCVNKDDNGVIPVAILGQHEFDVRNIDPASVILEGLRVGLRGKADKLLSHFEDVNADELEDLVMQMQDTDSIFSGDQGNATLVGKLFDGIEIEGTDTICVVP